MVDVLIERARNVRTGAEEVPSKATEDDVYVCIKCGQEVAPVGPFTDKHGIVYQRHFRHSPYAQTRECEWRSEFEVREIREQAIAEFEAESTSRRLRLFIEREVYGDQFQLFGETRALTIEELGVIRAAAGAPPGGHIKLSCTGALRSLSGGEILPSMGVLKIPLDPHAQKYDLDIDAPGDFELKGTWTGSPLVNPAVFIGHENSAEYIAKPRFLAEGQTVFILTHRSDDIPQDATKILLGKHQFIRLTVDRSLEEWMKARIGSLEAIARDPLRVSVVLPFLHDPRAERFIQAEPGDRCLIAVTPPMNCDPPLEIIAWTGSSHEQQTLPGTGMGQPRFVDFTVGEKPTHLLIHWPGSRGRDVRLQVAPRQNRGVQPEAKLPDFGVVDEDGNIALAEFDETLVLKPRLGDNPDHPVEVPAVRLEGFPQLEVRLTASYPDENGMPRLKDEGKVKGEAFTQRLSGILETGAKQIIVDFDTLGTATVEFDYYYDQRVKREAREEAERQAMHARRLEIMMPPPKTHHATPLATPDPLAALKARNKARVPTESPRLDVIDNKIQVELPRDRYSQLKQNEDALRRLEELRPFPRKASRKFAARVMGIKITSSTKEEVNEWRNPINRYIREFPDDGPLEANVERPQSNPTQGRENHQQDPDMDRTGSLSIAKAPARSASPQGELAIDGGISAELKLLRLELARIEVRITELERRITTDQRYSGATPPAKSLLHAPAASNTSVSVAISKVSGEIQEGVRIEADNGHPPPRVSKRALLKERKAQVARSRLPPTLHDKRNDHEGALEGGEIRSEVVEDENSGDETRSDGVELPPARIHKMRREIRQRIASIEGDLPKQVDAAYLASLYDCDVKIAAAFLAKNGAQLKADLERERRHRDD